MKNLLKLRCILDLAAFCLVVMSAVPPKDKTDKYYYWKILSGVKFISSFDKNTGEVLYTPVFSDNILQLDGKEITLPGFFSNNILEGKNIVMVFPFQGTGCRRMPDPSWTVELEGMNKLDIEELSRVEVKGILQIIDTNVFSPIYALKNPTIKKIETPNPPTDK